MNKTLEITKLKKTYRSDFLIRSYPALLGIDLSAEMGEIYGFLGPNGAGKTTTIKCMVNLIKPDSGSIVINGEPPTNPHVRSRIGFLPENPYFYDYLTGLELLAFSGRLFNMPADLIGQRSRELIRMVGLEGKEKIKLRKYSKGMLQRIGLAQAMIHDPDFLVLDEPFSGLDPIGRKELRDIILFQKENGKTIFFSSHILQDVEMIADKVGIILKGRMIREGRLTDLISHSVQYHEIVCSQISESILQAIHDRYFIKNGQYALKVESEKKISEVIESIIHNNGKIISVTPIKMSLEDIFIKEMTEGK